MTGLRYESRTLRLLGPSSLRSGKRAKPASDSGGISEGAYTCASVHVDESFASTMSCLSACDLHAAQIARVRVHAPRSGRCRYLQPCTPE